MYGSMLLLVRYLSKREIVGDVIEKMLMSLEEDGFIKTEEDEMRKGTHKGSLMKKIICIVATVVAISGCTTWWGSG